MKPGTHSGLTRRRFLAGAVPAVVAGAGSCAAAANRSALKFKRVVFVTMDTVRRDHLPFHGYPRPVAPFLTRLAKRSVVFDETICACSLTTPSHASMFTGLQLPQIGVYHNAYEALPEGLYTMAQLFRDQGYQTAGFASVVWMEKFAPGFSSFDCYDQTYLPEGSDRVYYGQAARTVDRAIAWLTTEAGKEPFFLWVHLYDPHDPYYPPSEVAGLMEDDFRENRSKLLAHWVDRQHKHTRVGRVDSERDFVTMHNGYDSEIRYVDREMERLYGAAGKAGLHDDSLWVFTSDHGEGLGAHGYLSHGRRINREQVSCPLLFHTPGGQLAPRTVPERVHHVDLMPTMAALLGTTLDTRPMTQQGESLLPVLLRRGATNPDRLLYCQRQGPTSFGVSVDLPQGPVVGLYCGRLSSIFHAEGNDEMYDLRTDPYQQQNFIDRVPPRLVEEMRDIALTRHRDLLAEHSNLTDARESDEHKESLEALGYL